MAATGTLVPTGVLVVQGGKGPGGEAQEDKAQEDEVMVDFVANTAALIKAAGHVGAAAEREEEEEEEELITLNGNKHRQLHLSLTPRNRRLRCLEASSASSLTG